MDFRTTMTDQMGGAAWGVYGHDWAVAHLRKGIAHRRVRHAYLIVGPESVGKETLARAFAMTLNCERSNPDERPCGECRACRLIAAGTHPDLLFSELDAATGALKIEEIRTVTGRLALKPFEARYRVAILRDFDRAQPRAQDALLKTLEEPPSYALLLLLARSGDALLSTITSRSQVLSLRPVSAGLVRDALVEHWGADPDRATLLARLCAGRIGWAVRALSEPALLEQRGAALDLLDEIVGQNRAGRFAVAEDLGRDKLSLVPLLELWQTYWRDLVLLCEGSRLAPSNYDRAAKLERLADQLTGDAALAALTSTAETINLLQYNLNVRLALETLFLSYPGL